MTFTKKPDGWFRAGDPDDDPFYLGLGLDDLEDRIETAILELGGDVEGPSETLGNDFTGDLSNNLNINHSVVIPITAPSTGIVTVEALVAGDQGGVGSTSLRGVVYDGVSSSSGLLGTGTPVAVTNGDPVAWVTVAEDIQVPSGSISVGFHIGGTNGVATGRYDTGPDGSSYFNNDTYSDGSADPFGTIFSSTVIQCIRCTFTEIPPDFITGLTIEDEGVPQGDEGTVTDIDFVGDNVSVSVVGTSATVTVTGADASTVGTTVEKTQYANFPFPAGAVIDSDPIICTGATLVIGGAAGDQAITAIQIYDSLDAATFRLHETSSTIVNRAYARVRVTNGGTVQGDSEANYATA
jgi:hypothetical protein